MKRLVNIEGYEVELDLSHQVLSLDLSDRWEQEEVVPFASLSKGFEGRFVPAAALAYKAKQFDDGLYAK